MTMVRRTAVSQVVLRYRPFRSPKSIADRSRGMISIEDAVACAGVRVVRRTTPTIVLGRAGRIHLRTHTSKRYYARLILVGSGMGRNAQDRRGLGTVAPHPPLSADHTEVASCQRRTNPVPSSSAGSISKRCSPVRYAMPVTSGITEEWPSALSPLMIRA